LYKKVVTPWSELFFDTGRKLWKLFVSVMVKEVMEGYGFNYCNYPVIEYSTTPSGFAPTDT
jgi:hypothetical protein